MDGPLDPLTPVAAIGLITHELFLSFTAAGFTEEQALYLTGQYVYAQSIIRGS